jgi:hypothetical protein
VEKWAGGHFGFPNFPDKSGKCFLKKKIGKNFLSAGIPHTRLHIF